MDQYYLFILLSPIASVITIWLAIYLWHHRTAPGALPLSLILLASTIWLIGDCLGLIAPDGQTAFLIAKLSYPFIASVPAL